MGRELGRRVRTPVAGQKLREHEESNHSTKRGEGDKVLNKGEGDKVLNKGKGGRDKMKKETIGQGGAT